jgi:hypothetical protein
MSPCRGADGGLQLGVLLALGDCWALRAVIDAAWLIRRLSPLCSGEWIRALYNVHHCHSQGLGSSLHEAPRSLQEFSELPLISNPLQYHIQLLFYRSLAAFPLIVRVYSPSQP